MSTVVEFCVNRASAEELTAHLSDCNTGFTPPLSERVSIANYAEKLVLQAIRFEAWHGNLLVGVIAVYCNDLEKQTAFITSVSVIPAWQGQRISTQLLACCLDHVRRREFRSIDLEVDHRSHPAIKLYEKYGFVVTHTNGASLFMSMTYEKTTPPMTTQRDYNVEIQDTADHQYAYGFDFDVMHPYMIRSFQPFFRPGSLLELGSFKGDFTRRFLEHFDDITCVEASGEALVDAQGRLGEKVQFVHSTFETAKLPRRYDNIVLTHVLEHLDDPVRVLKRINDEWLAEGGRFFLVCPNANAPSRQIAVKMGLISHNAAVTTAESEHGHRCTYTLDTLERDASKAGLRVVHRSGVFFKALANFQWDRLLQTDIISKEYLDGCYQLGQQYPDLCSSIFLMCESGH